MIEASLAIPSDLHLSGAQNAAVASRAFAPQLSSAVLQRGTAKGTPDLWLCDIIARHRAFLREILLDGLLIKERTLDKTRTEAALSGEVSRSKAQASAIIVQLYIESWLRRWTSQPDLVESGRVLQAPTGAASQAMDASGPILGGMGAAGPTRACPIMSTPRAHSGGRAATGEVLGGESRFNCSPEAARSRAVERPSSRPLCCFFAKQYLLVATGC